MRVFPKSRAGEIGIFSHGGPEFLCRNRMTKNPDIFRDARVYVFASLFIVPGSFFVGFASTDVVGGSSFFVPTC